VCATCVDIDDDGDVFSLVNRFELDEMITKRLDETQSVELVNHSLSLQGGEGDEYVKGLCRPLKGTGCLVLPCNLH